MSPRIPQALERCVQIADLTLPIPAERDSNRSAGIVCRDCPGNGFLLTSAAAPMWPAAASLLCVPLRKSRGNAACQTPKLQNFSAAPRSPTQFPHPASPDFLRRRSAARGKTRLRSPPRFFPDARISPVVPTSRKMKFFRPEATIPDLPDEWPKDLDPVVWTC